MRYEFGTGAAFLLPCIQRLCAREAIIDQTSVLCAHCQRCGRRSALGRADPSTLAPPANGEAPPRLRCDMCGGRQVKLFNASGPVEMLAFLNGRM